MTSNTFKTNWSNFFKGSQSAFNRNTIRRTRGEAERLLRYKAETGTSQTLKLLKYKP